MRKQKRYFAALASGLSVLALTVPLAEAAPFEFRGFYAGAHAGYIDADADSSTLSLDGDSLTGGLQAGYNFVNGNLVYGVETDIALAGEGPVGSCAFGTATCEIDMGPIGTLRLRAGYGTGDWLFYATGGAAGAHFDLTDSNGTDDDAGMFGWTVGGGAEYLLGDNVGMKLEYRYLQFGDFGGVEAELEDQFGNDIDLDMHVIMVGINWHF